MRSSAWLLVAGPLLFCVLFVSMRQDLQLHLLLLEKMTLESRREDLRQQLRADQRNLAARSDIARIAGEVGRRGLRAPQHKQVLALVDEPRVIEEDPSLPLAVLEFLSGAADVHASPSPPAGIEEPIVEPLPGLEREAGE
ncbi:MAG: hypothetical protein V1774_01125 [Candidatus Eisenbacteria bacterium]